jgi:regulator of sigma D
MSSEHNPVLQSLRRMNNKFDTNAEQINDFNRRQINGEHPDGDEFTKLMQTQATTRTAMTAQFNLLQKPLKTVLNETK